MANLGDVSVLNINGNEMTIKDAAVREIVNEIIEAIGANNTNIAERINNLHERSFDAEIKISSNNESEIASIQDGMYKLQYITITGEGDNEVETLNNSAILIQKGTNQYLYKDGQLSSRTKENNTWGEWEVDEIVSTLSNNYSMATGVNVDLSLVAGDTYEEAFGKLEKNIIDNELVTSTALTDLNSRINSINYPVISVNGMTGAVTINTGVTSFNGVTGAITYTAPVTSVNGITGAVTVDIPVTSVNGQTGAVTITETQLSKGTATGVGNAITDINVSNHQITLVKGATYTTLSDVQTEIANLVNSAPATLDTLNELAAALNDDPNFATTIAGQIGAKYTKPSTGIPYTDLATGVQASLDKADTALQEAPVTSINGATGAVVTQLSNNYSTSTGVNSDLELASGDTYEEAFGKLEKTISDNELVTASALTDLNSKINNIPIYDSTHKLSGDLIEDGTTNKIINVKPDWEATSGSAAEILNKPDLSNFLTIETQPNWNETNTSSAAYIQNKPTIPAAQIQADWNQSDTTAKDYIKNKPDIVVDQNEDMWINNYNNSHNVSIDGNIISLSAGGGIELIATDLFLSAENNIINFNTGTDADQLKIYGAEGVFIEGANNKNIKLTTIGNGKAYYNNNEIAIKNDIPTTSTTVTQNDTNPVSGGAVYNKFADLIGSAPAALDTLQEIATALNNDADLAGTLTTQISSKVPKVSNPTTDNFASFNSDGTIKDSGHSHSDYITSIKTVNNESLVGSGNIVVSGLPQVSASDNGKILMVVNGQWTLVSPSVLYSGNGVPNNANGNNGDLFIQTD